MAATPSNSECRTIASARLSSKGPCYGAASIRGQALQSIDGRPCDKAKGIGIVKDIRYLVSRQDLKEPEWEIRVRIQVRDARKTRVVRRGIQEDLTVSYQP